MLPNHRTAMLFGAGVPVELVLASGLSARTFVPAAVAYGRSDEFFLPGMPFATKAGLDRLLSGDLAEIALAVFASAGEEDALLYHSAKEVLRLGGGGAMPPLHLLVMPRDDHPAAIRYGIDQLRGLSARLSAASGSPLTEERLVKAVEQVNAQRAAGRRLNAVRNRGLVLGSDALTAWWEGRVIAPASHAAALDAWLDSIEGRAALERPRLLLMASEPLLDASLHMAIELAGAIVVGEDDPWGSSGVSPPLVLSGDPYAALQAHYARHTPSRAVFPHQRRNSWFYDNVRREDVAGVVFHLPASDRVLGWDYPRLRRFSESRGVPSIVIREPAGPAVTRAVRAFVEGGLS